MKISILSLFVLTAFSSCFLFKDYRKKDFVYKNNGHQILQSILVPKGYVKAERADTAGISLYSFRYADGAYLYAAYVADTTYELQSFNKKVHQPLFHRLGGLVYKGQTDDGLYYREIRQGNLRFGYRNVPSYLEFQFDSATNYASLQQH